MEVIAVDSAKEVLMKENEIFRSLVQKHEKYEKRLTELASLTYPNDEELLEESTLKKKKLAVKDELHAIMSEYSNGH